MLTPRALRSQGAREVARECKSQQSPGARAKFLFRAGAPPSQGVTGRRCSLALTGLHPAYSPGVVENQARASLVGSAPKQRGGEMFPSHVPVAHRQEDCFIGSGLLSAPEGGCQAGNKARALLCQGGTITATIRAVIKLSTSRLRPGIGSDSPRWHANWPSGVREETEAGGKSQPAGRAGHGILGYAPRCPGPRNSHNT